MLSESSGRCSSQNGGLQGFVSRKEHRYYKKQFEYRHGPAASSRCVFLRSAWARKKQCQPVERESLLPFSTHQKNEDSMSIPNGQMVGDQSLVALMEFIGGRLDNISSGISVNEGRPLESGSVERDDWEEGYLSALKDIIVFVQCLQSSAAA